MNLEESSTLDLLKLWQEYLTNRIAGLPTVLLT